MREMCATKMTAAVRASLASVEVNVTSRLVQDVKVVCGK